MYLGIVKKYKYFMVVFKLSVGLFFYFDLKLSVVVKVTTFSLYEPEKTVWVCP